MAVYTRDIVLIGSKAEKFQQLKSIYGWDLVDIYMMAAVLGFINNKKDIMEKDKDVSANLPRNVLSSRASKIEFIKEIITLSNELGTGDDEKAMKLAFETNSIEDTSNLYKDDLFNDYVMGGIDILYNMLSNVVYDNQLDNLKDIIERFFANSNVSKKNINDIFDEEGL